MALIRSLNIIRVLLPQSKGSVRMISQVAGFSSDDNSDSDDDMPRPNTFFFKTDLRPLYTPESRDFGLYTVSVASPEKYVDIALQRLYELRRDIEPPLATAISEELSLMNKFRKINASQFQIVAMEKITPPDMIPNGIIYGGLELRRCLPIELHHGDVFPEFIEGLGHDAGFISNVFAAKCLKDKGVERRLVRYAEDILLNSELQVVYTKFDPDDTQKLRFFEKLGYVKVSYDQSVWMKDL